MPTPFYHLFLAQNLLVVPNLQPAAVEFLSQHWGAFLLGNVAPDVQVITNQDREVTHFFDLPIPANAPFPWQRLFHLYPGLKTPGSDSQAAFLAGYVCHLAADWHWVLQIFAPVFGPGAAWASFGTRLYLHNVLRSFLDRQVVKDLKAETGEVLQETRPRHWLPFVADQHLADWRDFLSPQLQPGAAVSTVEVFASRQGIDPDAFYALLNSDERMNQEVFNRIPYQQIERYRQSLQVECASLIQAFLAKCL